MVSELAATPKGADTWRAPQAEAPVSLSSEHVVDRITGPNGTRIKLDRAAFRPAPELRAGSGHTGSGIGEHRPIVAQPLVEAIPLSIAPGEVRI